MYIRVVHGGRFCSRNLNRFHAAIHTVNVRVKAVAVAKSAPLFGPNISLILYSDNHTQYLVTHVSIL